jgi:hypothetical protein
MNAARSRGESGRCGFSSYDTYKLYILIMRTNFWQNKAKIANYYKGIC